MCNNRITITHHLSGWSEASTIHNGYRVHKMYQGYSDREVRRKFREYLKTIQP